MPIAPVTPAVVNFKIYQYASFNEPVTLKDANGNPIDVTDCTARMQIRRDPSDITPVFTLTTENGGIAMGNTNGLITINIPFAQTNMTVDLDGEVWYHDLLLKSADAATVQRTFQGVVCVFPAITQPT